MYRVAHTAGHFTLHAPMYNICIQSGILQDLAVLTNVQKLNMIHLQFTSAQ